MKTRLLTLLVLIFSLLLAPVVVRAQGSAGPDAAVARVSTITVQPYLPFQTATAHVQEAYSGAMGSLFTYNAGGFGAEHISNLAYTPNTGVTCGHDAALLITCTGAAISQVTIDFDYTYTANDYAGGRIWWGYPGYSNYAIDYTFNLIYPAPLVYLHAYSLEPTSVTGTQITWHLDNTLSLPGAALFRDPRVPLTYLPLVAR